MPTPWLYSQDIEFHLTMQQNSLCKKTTRIQKQKDSDKMNEEKASISVIEVSDNEIHPLKNVAQCQVKPCEITRIDRMVKYEQFYIVQLKKKDSFLFLV